MATVAQSIPARKCRLCDGEPVPGRECCTRCEPVFRERLARKRSRRATAQQKRVDNHTRPVWAFPRRQS